MKDFPDNSVGKNLPAMWEIWVQSLSGEDPLEKGKVIYSSILAWRIPWTIQSQRVRHDPKSWTRPKELDTSQSPTQLSNFHFTFTYAIVNDIF